MLGHVAEMIERWMAGWISRRELPSNLRAAIEYAALAPGKRLRPALVIRCCEAAGGEASDALPAAAAMELIHNFSLVHDDLPAMDDDALRRGRPTLHIEAGEAMAILAGDAMLSLAFEMLCDTPDDELAARLCRELAQSTTDMIAGQVYDTLGGFDPGLTDEQRLHLIHHNKTGALLCAACRMGALAGEADRETLETLTTYGEHLGLMFQIVDDVLDVTQSTEHLGKQSNKDAGMGKLTFPALLGLDASKQQIEHLRTQAHALLDPLGPNARPLGELADFLAVRTR